MAGRSIITGADRDRGQIDHDDVELVVVTMRFDAADSQALAGVLARYVVLTRAEPGCRNVDLCASALVPGRMLVIEKWASPATQRAHFDAETMVAMAEACRGMLTRPPDIELWDGISAHDLA
jgi:quinol monooxygenase YgiN